VREPEWLTAPPEPSLNWLFCVACLSGDFLLAWLREAGYTFMARLVMAGRRGRRVARLVPVTAGMDWCRTAWLVTIAGRLAA
jgi:hypothetical protein